MPRIECRYCHKELEYEKVSDLPYFPFCSERCKMADLSLWFDEKHRIEGEEIAEGEGVPLEGEEEPSGS